MSNLNKMKKETMKNTGEDLSGLRMEQSEQRVTADNAQGLQCILNCWSLVGIWTFL